MLNMQNNNKQILFLVIAFFFYLMKPSYGHTKLLTGFFYLITSYM